MRFTDDRTRRSGRCPEALRSFRTLSGAHILDRSIEAMAPRLLSLTSMSHISGGDEHDAVLRDQRRIQAFLPYARLLMSAGLSIEEVIDELRRQQLSSCLAECVVVLCSMPEAIEIS